MPHAFRLCPLVLCVPLLFAGGCNTPDTGKTPKLPGGGIESTSDGACGKVDSPIELPTKFAVEKCDGDVGRMVEHASRADGKNDLRRVFNPSTGVEICQAVDIHRNGKFDLVLHFDADGKTTRRRAFGFGENGQTTAIEYYQGGKLVRREYDTTGHHKIDTWETFDPSAVPDPKSGKLTPKCRQRDTRGDGRIHQWWSFAGQKIFVRNDKDGNGIPNPESEIVLGPEGDNVRPHGTDAGSPPDADAGPQDGSVAVPAIPSVVPSDRPRPPIPAPSDMPRPLSRPDAGRRLR